MIDLRKTAKDYYGCNSCAGEIDIYWITVGQSANHASIKLCNECRLELIEQLKHVSKETQNDQ